MKPLTIPRLPLVAMFWAVGVTVVQALLCYPAATSRGYPPIHPFWESLALAIAVPGLFVCLLFDDGRVSRRLVRYFFLPICMLCLLVARTNVTSARPHIGHSAGINGVIEANLFSLMILLPLLCLVAIPSYCVLEAGATRGWDRVRGFSVKGDGLSVFRFTLPALLGSAGVVCVGCAMALYIPVWYEAWPRYEWSYQCGRDLKRLTMAMHNYHITHGTFPPAYFADADGNPAHSWRVILLPQLGEQELYDEYAFDEPWDSSNNSKLVERLPDCYRCRWDDGAKLGYSSYLAITGPGTAFDADKSVAVAAFTDGTSNTAILAERSDSGVPWTAPVDIAADEIIAARRSGVPTLRCHHGGAAYEVSHVAMADAVTEFVTDGNTSLAGLKAAMTIGGGEPLTVSDKVRQ